MKYCSTPALTVMLFLLVLPANMMAQDAPASEPLRPPAYKLLSPDKAWVARTMQEMTLRDKVAQLIAVRAFGKFLNRNSREFQDLETEVRQNHIGGVVLFAGSVYESAVLLNSLQERSPLPLLISADFERGVSFRITDTTSFPWTMAVGAVGSEELAFQQGEVTAREARALGVHWIHAPVMDVNNNPDNPVINIRSYGEDPKLVARLGAAFIRGARQNGVMTTAKHFPGHGNTATDTHIGLAVVASNQQRLEALELVPFRSAIEAGVDAIMTAHVAVPEITGDGTLPATLSPGILTGLLRDKLQFQGIISTDAMEMGGITSRFWCGQAAIKALQAGADVLLLPPDTGVAIEEIVRAIRRGDLSETSIDRSVEKILTAKSTLGLERRRSVPLDNIDQVIASPEHMRVAQEIADRSITLLMDSAHLVPINPVRPPKLFSLVLSSEPDLAPGAIFQAEMKRRFSLLRTASIDTRMDEGLVVGILKDAAESEVIVCSVLTRLVSGKGKVALLDAHRILIEKLASLGKPVILVALGNPYVLRTVPQVSAYLCTFSYSDVSQTATAKALAGEIPVTGRMPVSIPGHSQVGDGLQIPRLDMTLHRQQPQSLGLAPDAFKETERLLASYVEKKAFPGAALVVGYRGAIVFDGGAGRLDYGPDSDLADGETIYDLASLSKAVGTTSAAMMLVESRRLLLDATVRDYLPEFEGENKEKVRVRNLLTHTSGLSPFKPLYLEAQDREKILRAICALPLEYQPGAKTEYSDLGMILMGEIIQRAAGKPLDRFLSDRLFGPLGMKSTEYTPATKFKPRIAPTEIDPWRNRLIRGEVHDENAYAMGGVSGHAGLFSTTHDLAVFAQALLNGGVYDHRRYFNFETIARFTSKQSSQADARGLGWGKPVSDDWTGRIFSPAAFGHTGFTGTLIWLDPQRQLFIVLLSNRVHPTRENTLIDEAEQAICESVIRAVVGRAANAVETNPDSRRYK